jgi:hypothetical protein
MEIFSAFGIVFIALADPIATHNSRCVARSALEMNQIHISANCV